MNGPTRRDVLVAGVGLASATAGCLSSPTDDDQTPTSTPTESDRTPTSTGDDQTPTPTEPGALLPNPVAGDPDADVTVAVYEDYACPHCRTYTEEVFPQVEETYLSDGDVRYEFHDFPIPVDLAVSWQAASAARAVQDAVGDAAFFTYKSRLFANQSRLDPDVYAEQTDGLDVDGETVREAATNERYRATVEADRQGGLDRDVQGTPTVLVDGEPVQWSEVAFEPVRDAIEAAIGE